MRGFQSGARCSAGPTLTNNGMTNGEHLTLAQGRDYSDVAPARGVALGGGEQVISVSVDISAKNRDDLSGNDSSPH
jgi:transglutaminase-like putative cysteine protease